jgi:Rrf2 family protein
MGDSHIQMNNSASRVFPRSPVLSHTSDYALRAMLVLAQRHGGPAVRAEEIAAATGAPRNYLGKTLHALVKAGLVRSARGPAGGFVLALPPGALTVAAVIDCFDDPRPSGHCLVGAGPCNPARPCAAHHRWTAVLAARRAPLTATTLADLLGDRPTTQPHATPAVASAA